MAHPEVRRLADGTEETEGLDYDFRFEGEPVHVDLKEKLQPLSRDYVDLWPEVPAHELFVLDETSLRTLLWAEGMGYLLVHDRPGRRWLVFGPWELALGPRRRFERLGDKGKGTFLKGKLLLDLRTAAAVEGDIPIDALLRVIRATRDARKQVGAFSVPGHRLLPVIPRSVPSSWPSSASMDGPDSESAEDEPPATNWPGLDQSLARHLEAKGWLAPTEVQALALPEILRGANVLVSAPTAGGKTEAALLPVLSLLADEGWSPTSVLMISPMKALLADQIERVRPLAAVVDRTTFAWHGDSSTEARRRYVEKPTDLLLTTPESLERLLARPPGGGIDLLQRLRVVILDEIHLWLGTPRGAQVAALLERLANRANADIQRIGLSATLGDADQALAWLSGGSHRDARTAVVRSVTRGEELAVIGGIAGREGAIVQPLTAGSRAIVFTPSRRRAEQMAHALGAPVHHSSLPAEEPSTGRTFRSRATQPTNGCFSSTAGGGESSQRTGLPQQ